MRIDGDRQIRAQIDTGQNFAAADAQAKIERFIRTLPTPPRSISIAIPGLIDRHGIVIACDVYHSYLLGSLRALRSRAERLLGIGFKSSTGFWHGGIAVTIPARKSAAALS
jgi:hypothetical protein